MAIQPNADASAATTSLPPNPRGSELAAFLRKHRAAIDPELAGFPRGERRRTPGLRREELAMLADVSATWYTWLEQGRAINVSPAVLGRIATALRLDPAEVDYLSTLTGRNHGPIERPPNRLDPAVAELIEHLGAVPVLVYDEHWDVIGANAMARALLGYEVAGDPCRDNIIWRLFLDEGKRASYREWPAEARRVVAQFRRSYGRSPADPRFVELLAQLRGSREFAAWWDDMNVAERGAEIGAVTLRTHPQIGDYTMRQVTLSVAGDDLLRINAPTPADAESAEKLARFFAALERSR
jgi:transcriptional regulator with XRE-family HTH domain